VVIHGSVFETVLASGPLLPEDAATKTPALAAPRRARCSSSGALPSLPSDMLMTSAPSAVAWSMAATMSESWHPSSVSTAGSGPSQQTLYAAILAAGATPAIVSSVRPWMTASTPALPAAVLAVWDPCPSTSSGDSLSCGPIGSVVRSRPAMYDRAPTSLVEQSAAVKPSPVSHVPWKTLPSALRNAMPVPSRYGSAPGVDPSGLPANDGLSGAMPVSMSAITVPAPAFPTPPVAAQSPWSPSRPRERVAGVDCGCSVRSGSTLRTSAERPRARTCAAVSSAEKPFVVSEYSCVGVAPTESATLRCAWARWSE
jgi:hypothetical protein